MTNFFDRARTSGISWALYQFFLKSVVVSQIKITVRNDKVHPDRLYTAHDNVTEQIT